MAESIVRYSFTAKIGTLEEEDPCIKGKDECGPNSQCIVDGDNFRCVCEQGYDYIFDETENALICLDINECDIGRDLCHAEAVCINSEGSYACKCQNGYTGDGYYCNPEVTCNNAGCDSNAFCRVINQIPECECNVGYKGDGFFCTADFGDESCHILQNCSPYAVCAPTANGYACRCLQGYMGDGYYCDVDSQNQAGDLYNIPYGGSGYPQEGAEQQPLPPSYPDSIPTLRPYQPNEQLDNNLNERPLEEIQPTCLLEICWCPAGYDYNRLEGTCVESSSAPFDLNPIPQCHGDSSCSCPSGYLYNPIYGRCDTISEAPPCNVVNNCHPNAHCMHHGLTGTSECTCNTGYVGDGFSCRPVDVSCDQVDICHYNADCIYDDIQLRSVCVCKPEFSGDGLVCLPKDNCDSGSECDANAQCLFDSSSQRFLCTCNEGFSGDGFSCLADREEESCATLRNCDPDADCQFSPESRRYECRCRDGFEGDGVQCLQVQTGCNPACGTNADCIYDGYNRRYDCKCIPGFTGDGMYCREAQTCISDHSICDPNALCQRTSSDEYDHACICISGYTGDGFSCEKSPDHEKNILLINQGLSVLRMSIDINSGNGFPIHVDPFMTAVGADVDCLNGLYYWTDVASQTIRSSKYDGQDKKPVITGGVTGSPEDVTVDWISRNIYWTDSKNNVLGVAEMDGMMTKTVIEGNLVNPRGITCHPGLGFLFWSDWNRDNPKIEKSGMDGSERTVLVSGTGVSLPNSLAIDFETSTLCWADAGMHRIECIGIQGYGRRIIIDGIKYPFGLALHTNSFFYTDWNDTRIHEVSKYTGKEESSRIPPPGGSGRLYGIAVVPDQCPPVSNVCQVNKGNCPSTHLCLPNGRGGRTCACPDQASEEECTDRQY